MEWKKHLNLRGKHACLSPSQPCWLKYDPERLMQYVITRKAAEKGTELHEWAAKTINLGIKQAVPRGQIRTLESYVNDAIKYHMDTEVTLYYSDNCFGTADAISYRNGELRIHDLKTGTGRIHPEQLVAYAALFCLEYHENPESMSLIELRIYQNDEILILDVTAEDIRDAMERIKENDELIQGSIYR